VKLCARKFCTLVIAFFTTASYAEGVRQQHNLELVKLQDCEFTVGFPTKTQRKRVLVGGTESEMVQSVYDEGSPYMRAECLPIADRSKTAKHFRGVIEKQASVAGISTPEITIGEDKVDVGWSAPILEYVWRAGTAYGPMASSYSESARC
jgi:hypothetical protein